MTKRMDLDSRLREWGRNVDREFPQEHRLPDHIGLADKGEQERPLLLFPLLRPVAAALVILLFGGIWFLTKQEPVTAGYEELAEDMEAVYVEIARMFPDQSVWMSETGEDIEIGMEALPISTSGPRVLLRVAVQKRLADGDWEEVWRRDVVTKETVWVNSASEQQPDQKLSVWAHAHEQGVWMVESHLELPRPYGIHIREQLLMETTGTQPAVREVELRPGLRMIQKMIELPMGGYGA